MRKPSISILALTLVAAACSEDAAGPRGDALSRAEAGVLAGVILSSGESAASSSSGTVRGQVNDGTAAAPIEFAHELRTTHPCPAGGSVALDLAVNGVADRATGSFEIELEGEQVHDDCAFPHQGLTFTVSGAPGLAFAASAAATKHAPSAPFTFEVAGALDWSASDGRTGTCDVRIDAVTDFEARTRTVDAQVCGHTVRETTTWR